MIKHSGDDVPWCLSTLPATSPVTALCLLHTGAGGQAGLGALSEAEVRLASSQGRRVLDCPPLSAWGEREGGEVSAVLGS